jgi:hypothetical protein
MVAINNVVGGTWSNVTQETPGVYGGGGGSGSPNAYPQVVGTDLVPEFYPFITVPTGFDANYWTVYNNFNANPGQPGGDGIFCLYANTENQTSTYACGYSSVNNALINAISGINGYIIITDASSNNEGVGPTIYGNASQFTNAYDNSDNPIADININGVLYNSIIVGPGNYTIETNYPEVNVLLTAGGGGGAGGPCYPFSYQCSPYYAPTSGLAKSAVIAGGGGVANGGGGGGGAFVRQLFLYDVTTIGNQGGTNNNSVVTRFTVSVGTGGIGGGGGSAPLNATTTAPPYSGSSLSTNFSGGSGSSGTASTLIIDQLASGPFAQILPITYVCTPGEGGGICGPLDETGQVTNTTVGGKGGAGGVCNITNENPSVTATNDPDNVLWFTMNNYNGGDGTHTVTSQFFDDVTFNYDGDGYGPFNYQNAVNTNGSPPLNQGSYFFAGFSVPVQPQIGSPYGSDYLKINVGGGGGGGSGYGCWNGYSNFTNPPNTSQTINPVNTQGSGGGGGIGGNAPIFTPNVNTTNPLAIAELVYKVASNIAGIQQSSEKIANSLLAAYQFLS